MHTATTRPPTTTEQAAPIGQSAPRARIPVAVLADLPLIAQGFGELLRGMRLFDVLVATTDLEHVLELVADGEVRVVVLTVAPASTQDVLEGIDDAAAVAGAAVGTVHVVPPRSSWPVGAAGLEASVVVTTADGADGLARAVFEARRSRPVSVGGGARRAGSVAHAGRAGTALTPRELEVLQGIADGLGSRHIAERLGVSVHTVRTHVQRLLPKLGVHTRLRATAVALEEGLVAQRAASRPSSRRRVSPGAARTVATEE